MPLTNVLSGKSPDGKRQLVQIQQQTGTGSKREKRRDRAPGYDLTFSLPKSISALYAVGSDQVRLAIDLAMDRASKKVIEYLERSLPLGRRGKGGCIQEQAKLIVGMFDHDVNRHLEPQRHRHCVVANICQLENGSWRSINSPLLHKWTRTLGPIFRSQFAHELAQTGLGLELYLPDDGKGKSKTASFSAMGIGLLHFSLGAP
jgi:conjugative relaxase-like TrwC/TraI family protein